MPQHRVIQNLGCGIELNSPYAQAVVADSPVYYWQLQEFDNPASTFSFDDFMGSGYALLNSRPSGLIPFPRQPGALTTAACDKSVGTTGGTGNSSTAIDRNNVTPSYVTDNFSLEFWTKPTTDTTGTNCGVLIFAGSAGGWTFVTTAATRKWAVVWPGKTMTTTSQVTGDVWHHFVVVCASHVWTYYIDGAVDVSNAGTGTPNFNYTGIQNDNFIVRIAHGGASGNSEYMSHVAYYHTALSSTQVSNHYAAR